MVLEDVRVHHWVDLVVGPHGPSGIQGAFEKALLDVEGSSVSLYGTCLFLGRVLGV